MMESTKKKRGIGLLDILIIILVIAGVAIAIRFAVPSSSEEGGGSGDSLIRYTIEVYDRDLSYVEGIAAGEKIFENIKGVNIGEIVDVKIVPYQTSAADTEAGIYRLTNVEGRYNAHVTIEGYGSISDEFILINDIPIAVGRELFVRAKSFAGGSYVIVLEKEAK